MDAGGSNLAVITLVLRGKGDHEAFVSKFWEAWRARAWESETPKSGSSSGTGGSGSREGESGWSSNGLRLAGVSGILRKEQEMWESTDKSLQEAFQDLNALMVCVFCGISCLVAEKVLEMNRGVEMRIILCCWKCKKLNMEWKTCLLTWKRFSECIILRKYGSY